MLSTLEAVPAMRRIETDRDDLFALEIAGHVSAADMENLYGLMEGAYALHPSLDLLVRIVDFDGLDWDEVSRETIADGKARAIEHVRRCAAIGEPNWLPQVQGLFEPKIPVELRHFALQDEAQAWAWLGAREIPQTT